MRFSGKQYSRLFGKVRAEVQSKAKPPPVKRQAPFFAALLPRVDLSASELLDLDAVGGIVFRGLPVPPSENRAYRNITASHRVKTVETVAFASAFERWALDNLTLVARARAYLGPAPTIQVEAYVGLEAHRMVTKDGRPKRIDAQNFLKILLDVLAVVLGRDDSTFVRVVVAKYQIADCTRGAVTVKLRPMDQMTPQQVERALLCSD